MSGAVERGAAQFVVTLSGGTITVTHGECGTVLAVLCDAPEGTWDRLWAAMKELGIRRGVEG